MGWYHSHPGFGVEFSDMDRFIQKNFFPSPTQIALVTDPLGGDVAICFNSSAGIRNLPRFWVDGREHQCRSTEPEPTARESTGGPSSAGSGDLRAIEARLAQLTAALDEERTRFHRVLMTLFFVVAFAVVALIGWHIWDGFVSRNEPPKRVQFAQVPVQIGDQTVLLGIDLVSWEIPPRLNAMIREVARLEWEKAQAALTNAALTNAPVGATNSSPAPAAPTK